MKRFNETPTGYRFDKLLFWAATLGLLVWFGFLVQENSFHYKAYLKCESILCENPYYERLYMENNFLPIKIPIDCTQPWCKEKYVSMGEYGEKEKEYHFFLVTLIAFALAFVLNHFIHNRGVKFSLPHAQMKLISRIKDIGEKIEDDEYKKQK